MARYPPVILIKARHPFSSFGKLAWYRRQTEARGSDFRDLLVENADSLSGAKVTETEKICLTETAASDPAPSAASVVVAVRIKVYPLRKKAEERKERPSQGGVDLVVSNLRRGREGRCHGRIKPACL
jgi:hypothetical protein